MISLIQKNKKNTTAGREIDAISRDNVCHLPNLKL